MIALKESLHECGVMGKVIAYAAMAAGKSLEPFTYEIKRLGSYEVVVDVICAGVCHSDVSLIDNEWNTSLYPLVPGHEIVGIIAEVGDKVDKELIGKRVGIGWQHGSCLTCNSCLHGFQNVCADKTLTCVGHYGGFGTKIIGDSRFTYLIPDKLASEVAAPLLCAGATVFSPLSEAGLKEGARVAILGVGGLGHLALQFAKALEYHVTAISGSKDKKEEALRFGADDFLTTSDLAGKERSFEFILSTYKLHENGDKMISLLAPFGTLCLVTPESLNFTSSSLISFKRKLKGTTTASPSVMRTMLEFAANNNIAPKIEKMPFSQINEAIQRVREGKARYRIVLTQS